MARRIETPQTRSPYPQLRRFAAMFAASLKKPVPPSVVGEKVLEIVDSGTWQLRHPVGPDAVSFLQWRKAMSDEEWVAWGALGDDADRKSTRLNSSHLVISYAVFCLKKKK